jgi:hypothetical protein
MSHPCPGVTVRSGYRSGYTPEHRGDSGGPDSYQLVCIGALVDLGEGVAEVVG